MVAASDSFNNGQISSDFVGLAVSHNDNVGDSTAATPLLVSIIVPVYNGHNFITSAIQSVLNQQLGANYSLKNVEMLLIDDGSTDNSLDVLKSYEVKYPNLIRVFERKNYGVGQTRNFGIEQAQGEYVTFLDQDDTIDPDFIQMFLDELNKLNANAKAKDSQAVDVLIGGYYRSQLADSDKTNSRRVQSACPYDNGHPNHWYKYKVVPAWAKLHRREFLVANQIVFFENNIGEDIVFTIRENLLGQVHYINYIGYNWSISTASTSATWHTGLNPQVQLFELLEEILKLRKLTDTSSEIVEFLAVKTALYYLFTSSKGAKAADFESLLVRIDLWLNQQIPSWARNRYLHKVPSSERATVVCARLFRILTSSSCNSLCSSLVKWVFVKVWCRK
jgi:glycosyltransferase involved in cell wall biosynthesis